MAKGGFSFPVENIPVLDPTAYSDREMFRFNFRNDNVVVSVAGRGNMQESVALNRWAVRRNNRWEQMNWVHGQICKVWVVNNVPRIKVGNARTFSYKSVGRAVDTYRKVHSVIGGIDLGRKRQRLYIDSQSRPFLADVKFGILLGCAGCPATDYRLINQKSKGRETENNQPPFGPFEGCVPLWRAITGICGIAAGLAVLIVCLRRGYTVVGLCLGIALGETGTVVWLTGHYDCDEAERPNCKIDSHADQLYYEKLLTRYTFCSTVCDMANVLSAEKQTAIIAALAEGSSIRSIERITGVHRDTIMRLGVKVGQGCTALLDEKMRNLPCRLLQFDEVWGFIGKKERHVRPDDDPQYGNVWTFCAIDAETKLVPSFKCGKRDLATAKTFVADVQSRMAGRVQISSDALKAYQDAIEQTFGMDVDFGQIIKTYEHDDSQNAERKYSAAKFVSVEKRSVTGYPDMDLVSTSYIERLNATTRLHMRRLTRLTLAFSKKLENFEAAVGLHFAYYNLVKRHGSLRMTPAMAAGIERDFWSVGQLVQATI
jgi:IS1 family transposase